jgi:hypothetical protein
MKEVWEGKEFVHKQQLFKKCKYKEKTLNRPHNMKSLGRTE